MRYGVREICNVVFKAKADMTIGQTLFKRGQPVLYIDSAKTSAMEGGATTVYATGGRGNTRLVTWEGEKTLTFTVEDALLSPLGFAILSGAGLLKKADATADADGQVYVHKTAYGYVDNSGVIDLTDALTSNEKINNSAPLFILETEGDGSLTGTMLAVSQITNTDAAEGTPKKNTITVGATNKNKNVFIDFYTLKTAANVAELQIDAAHFGGYFYVEASTLFRRQIDGVDAPVEITYPNVKIQSNFTFNMASTGDPSTFTFTMDAMPGYTWFDSTKKVLCVMQIIEDGTTLSEAGATSVKDTVVTDPAFEDSYT